MRLSLPLTVLAVAILVNLAVDASADTPEIQKPLAGMKPLIDVEPRTLGRKGRDAITIIHRIGGRKSKETRLMTRVAEAQVPYGLKNRIPYISGAAFRNSHCVFRFPTPKDHLLEPGSAVRLTLRGNHNFGRQTSASKKLTIAFLHDNDYPGTEDWQDLVPGRDCPCRLIIEKDRLSLIGKNRKPVWQSLKETSWKKNKENDLTFVVTSSSLEFWLNGKRTASQSFDNPLPPLNWIHVNVPHLYWGFNRFSFLQGRNSGTKRNERIRIDGGNAAYESLRHAGPLDSH